MLKTLTFAALAGALVSTAAFSADQRFSQMNTHPSQGEVTLVEASMARLQPTGDGVFVHVDTGGLTPGHVHTLWFVVINDPAACEGAGCTSKDVLKRSDIVQADVGYGGGMIADENGRIQFNWFQAHGALDGGWFGYGLDDGETSEVHLAINDHGPVLAGREEEMLSSYRGGCTTESIPAPMPAIAHLSGEEGPNTCRLMQFTIFKPAIPAS